MSLFLFVRVCISLNMELLTQWYLVVLCHKLQQNQHNKVHHIYDKEQQYLLNSVDCQLMIHHQQVEFRSRFLTVSCYEVLFIPIQQLLCNSSWLDAQRGTTSLAKKSIDSFTEPHQTVFKTTAQKIIDCVLSIILNENRLF